MKKEKGIDEEPYSDYDDYDSGYDLDTPLEAPKKKSIFRKILGAVGMGGLITGWVGLFGIMFFLHIIFVWGAGLSMISYGVYLLVNGSILWGLIVLFIGTPIAVGIAEFLFPFWMIILIIGIIIGLIRWIF